MAHDLHFMKRLERVDAPQAELALELYRDPALVGLLLSDHRLPGRAKRVALSLAASDNTLGPFIVIERDGRFVTCLGEGMKPGDLPVISRAALVRAQARLHSLHEAEANAHVMGRDNVARLVGRITESGELLSREEFEELAALQPLLWRLFETSWLRLPGRLQHLYQRLRSRQQYRREDRTALEEYYYAAWALAHLTILRGLDSDRPIDLTLGLRAEGDRIQNSNLMGIVSWPMAQTGMTGFAMRGAWLAAKIGKPLLPDAKRALAEAQTALIQLCASLTLFSMALHRRKLRGEVSKALARGSTPMGPEGSVGKFHEDFTDAIDKLLKACASPFKLPFYRKACCLCGRAIYEELLASRSTRPRHELAAESMKISDATALALVGMTPQPFAGMGEAGVTHVFTFTAAILDLAAADFYLPKNITSRIKGVDVATEVVPSMIDARRQADEAVKQEPVVRASAKISRNAGCPCGSGRKYKRCCA